MSIIGAGITGGAQAAAPFLMASHQAKLEERRLVMLEKMRASAAQTGREFTAEQNQLNRDADMDGLNKRLDVQREQLAESKRTNDANLAMNQERITLEARRVDLSEKQYQAQIEALGAQAAQEAGVDPKPFWSMVDRLLEEKTVNPLTGKDTGYTTMDAIREAGEAFRGGHGELGSSKPNPYGGAMRKMDAMGKPDTNFNVKDEMTRGLMGR